MIEVKAEEISRSHQQRGHFVRRLKLDAHRGTKNNSGRASHGHSMRTEDQTLFAVVMMAARFCRCTRDATSRGEGGASVIHAKCSSGSGHGYYTDGSFIPAWTPCRHMWALVALLPWTTTGFTGKNTPLSTASHSSRHEPTPSLVVRPNLEAFLQSSPLAFAPPRSHL